MENSSACKSVPPGKIPNQKVITNEVGMLKERKVDSDVESELRALRKLYRKIKGNILQRANLDEKSRLLLKKLQDGGSQQISQSIARETVTKQVVCRSFPESTQILRHDNSKMKVHSSTSAQLRDSEGLEKKQPLQSNSEGLEKKQPLQSNSEGLEKKQRLQSRDAPANEIENGKESQKPKQQLKLQSRDAIAKEIEIRKESQNDGEFDCPPIISKERDDINQNPQTSTTCRRPRKIKIAGMESKNGHARCRICKRREFKPRIPVEGKISGGKYRRSKESMKKHDHSRDHHHHHNHRSRKENGTESEDSELRKKIIHKNWQNSGSSRNLSVTPDPVASSIVIGNGMTEPPVNIPAVWVRTERGSFKKNHMQENENGKPVNVNISQVVASDIRPIDEYVPATQMQQYDKKCDRKTDFEDHMLSQKKQSQNYKPKFLLDQTMSQISGPHRVSNFPIKMHGQMQRSVSRTSEKTDLPGHMLSHSATLQELPGQKMRQMTRPVPENNPASQRRESTQIVGSCKKKNLETETWSQANQMQSEVHRTTENRDLPCQMLSHRGTLQEMPREKMREVTRPVHENNPASQKKSEPTRTVQLGSPHTVGSNKKKNWERETSSQTNQMPIQQMTRQKSEKSSENPLLSQRMIRPNEGKALPDQMPSHHHARVWSPHVGATSRVKPDPTRVKNVPKEKPSQTVSTQKRVKVPPRRMPSSRVRRSSKEKLGFREKLAFIFHHHHHHYVHHPRGGDQHDDVSLLDTSTKHHHRFRTYLRKLVHRPGKKNQNKLVADVHGERAVGSAPPHQHGVLITLLEGLLRHVWHPRKKRTAGLADRKRLEKAVSGRYHVKKKVHWWRRFHRRGGIKLKNRRKARLRLGMKGKS